jgi:hypothetical protein
MAKEPLGTGGRQAGIPEHCGLRELQNVAHAAASDQHRKVYGMDHAEANPFWEGVPRYRRRYA